MHPIVFPLITVFATVMFDGPVYAVKVMPDGTPVLDASGYAEPVDVVDWHVAVEAVSWACAERFPAAS
jgi:hypothetical protein